MRAPHSTPIREKPRAVEVRELNQAQTELANGPQRGERRQSFCGVIARAELLVARNGRFVAKTRVVRVEKNRCVANLIRGSQVAEIHEGDLLIPACPES